MLDNLIGSLKSEVGGKIMSQTKLPSGTMDKVFSIIGDVTKKEVGQQVTSGGIGNVMNLFSRQANNQGANMLQSNITNGVVSNLASKLGLSSDISKSIANIAVPALISMITKKNSETPDDDPSPLNDIFGGIGGKEGLGGAAKDMLGKLFRK